MHALDVVHGDIKTVLYQSTSCCYALLYHLIRILKENVLIDSQCRARLTDFGLATILHATATTATAGRGTVRYMAPELLDWEASNSTGRATQASDMYALAITIWRVSHFSHMFAQSRRLVDI
jgi:serine/threonine protein kinase